MNGIITIKQIKTLSAIMAGVFLAIHVAMFATFCFFHVTEMAYFNAFSVLFYVAMFYPISRERFKPFVIASFIEICLHMFLAVYFIGWR